MAAVAMTTADEPDGAPRLASLDILRGIAILGILFMNINDMGASMVASFGDIRHIGWSAADQFAWTIRAIFADGTARALLEMLFGVGMVILTDRAAAGTLPPPAEAVDWGPAARHWLFGPGAVMRPYYRRNLILFGFGLVHVFILLWPGDILHSYGLAALVAFLFRRLGRKTLLTIGLVMAVLQLGGGGYSYLTVPGKRAEAARLERVRAAGGTLTKPQAELVEQVQAGRKSRAEQHAKDARRIAAEDHGRTGTFVSWVQTQWRMTWELQRTGLELLIVWEAASFMLIGAALYKWDIIQGDRSRRFYAALLLIGYGIGLSTRALGAATELRFDSSPSIMWGMYDIARLTTTLGHIALLQLLLTTTIGQRLLQPFVAAGRMALSIYVGQTLICLWLLYPPFAFGLYGQQGWMALMLTALAVNAVLLFAANWYVRYYRIAPVEWAWRSIIAGRRLPIRLGQRATIDGVPTTA